VSDLIDRDNLSKYKEKFGCKEPIEVDAYYSGWNNAIDCIIENEPSAQQWIPVSEGLPEKPGRYLVTNCEFEVDWNIWVNGEWLYSNSAPVAWMDLPEPYQNEVSE